MHRFFSGDRQHSIMSDPEEDNDSSLFYNASCLLFVHVEILHLPLSSDASLPSFPRCISTRLSSNGKSKKVATAPPMEPATIFKF